ncbi:TetR/AcrR family transcriptional regulator [Liquorilactobacillus nagelii]|uniref:TetR/AcrR family transcriptional regulator n=1 Tax=Liquorilactobacillus nagelii TaxID=82688 RepID=UPI001CCEAC8F|nr:TetR/AcrR family transcriptional regulator [Liquorilactobacillus nagelii]ULQ48481.1 TetR/AcrR family transcriptional regulator [Liquorilactobacillus nagelii]
MTGKKNNCRSVCTQQLIRQTFLELLKDEEKVELIKVTDICRIAQITRGTFYRYYQSVPDLLDKLRTELFQQTMKLVKERFEKGERNLLPAIFEVMKRNDTNLVQATMNREYGQSFLEDVFKSYREAIRPTLKEKTPNLTDNQFDYYYSYVSNGVIGVILTWISKGMYQDTDVLESVVVDMILRSEEQLSRETKKLAEDN